MVVLLLINKIFWLAFVLFRYHNRCRVAGNAFNSLAPVSSIIKIFIFFKFVIMPHVLYSSIICEILLYNLQLVVIRYVLIYSDSDCSPLGKKLRWNGTIGLQLCWYRKYSHGISSICTTFWNLPAVGQPLITNAASSWLHVWCYAWMHHAGNVAR